jgi:LemA protein
LTDELAGTENRLSAARGRYNDRIREYNTSRRRFPANITAGIFGFKEYPYFEAPADSKAAPKVDFGK